jgi:hypothetical protein
MGSETIITVSFDATQRIALPGVDFAEFVNEK